MPPATHHQALAAPRDHFYALDAMRGMAALMVVCLHEYQAFSGLPQPFSGHLAVDLFFLLSGYVIASAYDQRLATGMSFGTFLKLRLIRLYPLYLIGFGIGFVRVLIQFKVGSAPPPMEAFAWGTIMELFMLPTPMTLGWQHDFAFFLNPPAWSLFFEIAVNILFAAVYRHLNQRVLLAILALSGIALIGAANQHHSIEIGNYWHTFLFGIPRVVFPFFLGIWMQRHAPRLPGLGNSFAWILTGLIALALAWHPQGYRLEYDLVMVMAVFPLSLIIATSIKASGFTEKACRSAGDLSYAIYIVHFPVFDMALAIIRRTSDDLTTRPYSGPLAILLVALLCLALDHFYDKPVRKWLARTLTPNTLASRPGPVGAP